MDFRDGTKKNILNSNPKLNLKEIKNSHLLKLKLIQLLLFFLVLVGCDTQSKYEIESDDILLQDEDFVDLVAISYIHFIEGEIGIIDEQFTDLSYRLNKRYNSFFSMAQRVLNSKGSSHYDEFNQKLILSINQKMKLKSNKSLYDAASICGQESCSDINASNTTIGCIAGVSFLEVYCIRHDMGDCTDMRDYGVNQCCSTFCNP